MIDMFKDMLFDWPLGTMLTLVILALVGFLAFVVVDYSCGVEQARSGTVIGKAYTAASTGTGVGPSTGGNGGVAVVVTSTPEKYTLFVEAPCGGVDKVGVTQEAWLKYEKGDIFEYSVRVGRLSGSVYL